MSGDQKTSDNSTNGGPSTPSGSVMGPPFGFVIPAYNEERRLPAAIKDIRTFFSSFQIPFEVLIAVEKSSDRTVEVAHQIIDGNKNFRVLASQEHRGKGYAVRCGMRESTAQIVFFMDADLSTPLAEVLAFLSHFEAHPECQILIGSRAHARSQVIKKQSWLRRNMGRTFNKFVRLFGIRGIEDTQCGFKAFRRDAAREIFSRCTLDGFAFDVEVLLLARKMGFHIDVLPVRWINSTDSKVRILIDPIKMLWDLIRIRPIVRKTLRERPFSPSISSSR
jgi:dolichyl-phosphate beta-glucosyltransferase